VTVNAFTETWNGCVPNRKFPWIDVCKKAKGVNNQQNLLRAMDYYRVLNDEACQQNWLYDDEAEEGSSKTIIQGANSNFQMRNGIMSKITLCKNILTAAHTKYKVSPDFVTCVPLFLETKEEKQRLQLIRDRHSAKMKRESETIRLNILRAEMTEEEVIEQRKESNSMWEIDHKFKKDSKDGIIGRTVNNVPKFQNNFITDSCREYMRAKRLI
jgi:hypothetical protein